MFQSIREHLPFPDLWRTYKAFRGKWDEYVNVCQELHIRVVTEATERWELSVLEGSEVGAGLTTSFSWETLDRAIKIAMGDPRAAMPDYDVIRRDGVDPGLEYLGFGDRVILCARDAIQYVEEHRSMVVEWARSERLAGYLKVLTELRELEGRIHDILEESLLRRDHILYACRLCPGEHRVAFK